MHSPDASLSPALLERILTKLAIAKRPEPTLAGLREVYGAWCAKVPFDNVRKLIHVAAGDAGPLPGSTPGDFFEAWLRHGTGGTCWAGNGAFAALLQALGFDAVRGVGTMLAAPELPPNHGTVRVTFDGKRYLTDCSILHAEPLLLDESLTPAIDHPVWGVRTSVREGRLHVWWRALHMPHGFECRLEFFGTDHDDFVRRHEETRGWSPFNYQVNARRNLPGRVTGLAFGNAVSLESDGTVSQRPVDDAERRRILVEEVGMSEEIVSQLPADCPTPPPPGSRTAQAQAEAA